MKARIKETGEVVSVIKDNHDDEYYVARKKDGMSIIIHNSEIDLLNTVYIDWEQRRYEIAKEVLAAQISDVEYAENNSEQILAKYAVKYADALIKELKNEREHEL